MLVIRNSISFVALYWRSFPNCIFKYRGIPGCHKRTLIRIYKKPCSDHHRLLFYLRSSWSGCAVSRGRCVRGCFGRFELSHGSFVMKTVEQNRSATSSEHHWHYSGKTQREAQTTTSQTTCTFSGPAPRLPGPTG